MDSSLNVHQDGESVSSGIKAINEINPDIVLLDIQLPDGTGFDILEQIGEHDYRVIFVTAHEEFAIRAIKCSALDYILKPVDRNELSEAIQRAIESIENDIDENDKYETLINNIQHDQKKMVLRTSESLFIVDLDSIMRCKSENNYTTFYLDDGRKIVTSRTMKEYEEALSYPYFMRCHRSHIINFNFVNRFNKNDGGMIIMKNDDEVPLSRKFRDRFFELLEKMI
jgi:two-component system LytT family response regulator